ncbi:zinc carboxypeptidase-like [Cydia pomonella]|uniref:zinc carboxypeptidase-like n=1 Tax=Cydia pomonella TaxID=82600 RepID=UPI002ADD9FCC|nr:zinc carboxypeptidase-like [Cydia pomonella]
MVRAIEIYSWSFILFISLLTSNADKNYTLYKLVALTKRDRQTLYIIHRNYDHSYFLNGVTNEAAIPMHVVVEDKYMTEFEGIVNNSDTLFTKYKQFHFAPQLIEDAWDSGELTDDNIIYKGFQDFSTIQKLYQYWENKYTKKIEKIVLGKTHEKKDIVILKVPGNESNGHKNPAIFILGGEAGLDWISPALVLAYMKSLLDEKFHPFTKRFDAYFLPVLNPDGYTYSLYRDRFWAKNRKIIQPRILCHPNLARGVNLDRNWLHKAKGERACGTMFLDNALSEYETYNLSEFLDQIAPNTLAFFNVKGFDNLITTPYAYGNKVQNNMDTIREILRQTTRDLNAKFNKSYYYGTTRSLLFNYTGNCADWVKENLNVPVVVTFYLTNIDNVLPEASDIGPLHYEFARGINEILSFTIDLYGPLFNQQCGQEYMIILLLLNVIIIF